MNYKKRFYAALLTVVLAAGVFAVGKSGIQMKAEQEQAQVDLILIWIWEISLGIFLEIYLEVEEELDALVMDL